jgi:hypothetical protein
MKKIHVAAVAVTLALASVFGIVAATRTAGLGAAAHATASGTPGATIAARQQRLDRLEASLRKALADRPPALPAVPSTPAAVAAPAPRVVYHRSAPIVVIKHRAGGEHDGFEAEGGEGGGDD